MMIGLLTAALLVTSTAYANKMDDGEKAFRNGNYKKAKALFMPLAAHPLA